MKTVASIFIIILAALTNQSCAQSLSIFTGNNILVNNGDTIEETGTNVWGISGMLRVQNNATSALTVSVTRTELSIVPGTTNMIGWGVLFCCGAPPYIGYLDNVIIASGAMDSTFLYSYDCPGLAGTSFIRYTFADQNNPADTVSVVLKYTNILSTGLAHNGSEAGLRVYPNPSKGIYFVEATGNNSAVNDFQIFNASGQLVLTMPIENKSSYFQIDLSNQVAGSYTAVWRDYRKESFQSIRLIRE